MKISSNKTISTFLQRFIEKFENKILNEKDNSQYSGIVYTPSEIADFIVRNLFRIYIEDFLVNFNLKTNVIFSKGFNLKALQLFLRKHPNIKRKLTERIKSLKILDPACGSGRFLISTANLLLKIYKILDIGLNDCDAKKKILENTLYGIEIEKTASIISKVRLISWLLSNNEDSSKRDSNNFINASLEDLTQINDKINVSLNIFNLDFLLDFDINEFDIIVGNPPYIENKKIKDIDYKKKLNKNFKSAYKLFDLSIVFIEKSLNVLKENEGYLSFITMNKFLSADYGAKIRELVVNNTELKELINISSLKVFKNIAAYPIIITIKKSKVHNRNKVSIKKVDNLKDLINFDYVYSNIYPQELIRLMPGNVIPISGDLDLVRYLYTHFIPMAESINDLKIIYRPFGFLKWAKFFNNLSELKNSDNDMLLIGTGNVGKFHIKFNKRIKIAKKNIAVSYFKYAQKFKDVFIELQCEKLIFREVAKNLTFVYDPGYFTNITGLYFIKIPSYDTNKLFCLLVILNSRLMDSVFKTLFGSLHMAGGYLRFNGSFIKRLPMPRYFPTSISYLGKILQFLSQLKYELLINSNYKLFEGIILENIENYLEFFQVLGNSLVDFLFMKNFIKNQNKDFLILEDLIQYDHIFPDIGSKYIFTRYNLLNIQRKEFIDILHKIRNNYLKIKNNSKLIKDMERIKNILYN